MKYLLLILLTSLSFQSMSLAKTEVYQDQTYIYFKTPLKELAQYERRHLIRESMDLLLGYVKQYLSFSTQLNQRGQIELLKSAHDQLDPMVADVEKYVNPRNLPGLRWVDAIPSGILVFAGGAFTQGLKLSGGGSVSLGVVIVPSRVIVIEKTTQKVTTYYPLETALVLMPSLNLGVGVGGGGPRIRVGAGLIWGTLESPEDFAGLSMGISGGITALQGVNYKAAILRQYSKAYYNVFGTLAFEFGPAAVAEVHGNVLPIFALGETLNSLFGVGEQVVIREAPQQPEPNLEELKRKYGLQVQPPPAELKKLTEKPESK
jgi:hypothetical protein